ncbi:hypothetical protein T439DRAFT_375839 [Meredithblackwellia eburnea MCA 4105]
MSTTTTRVLRSSSKKNPSSKTPFPPEILSVIIKFSVEPISADHGVSPRRYKRLLNFMRVSREWYQVTLPELYVLVHITYLPSMRALTRTLSNSTVSGRLPPIRWLWIDFERERSVHDVNFEINSWDKFEQGLKETTCFWHCQSEAEAEATRFHRTDLPQLLALCPALLHFRLDNFPLLSMKDLITSQSKSTASASPISIPMPVKLTSTCNIDQLPTYCPDLESLEIGDIRILENMDWDPKDDSLPNLKHLSLIPSLPEWMNEVPYPRWADSFLNPDLFPNLQHLFWHRIDEEEGRYEWKWSTITVGSLGAQLRSLTIGKICHSFDTADPREADRLLQPALATCTALEKVEFLYPVKFGHFIRNIPSKIKELVLRWGVGYEVNYDGLETALLECFKQDPTSFGALKKLTIAKVPYSDWRRRVLVDVPYSLTEEGKEELLNGLIEEPDWALIDEFAKDTPYILWTEQEMQENFKLFRQDLRQWCEERNVQLIETDKGPTGNHWKYPPPQGWENGRYRTMEIEYSEERWMSDKDVYYEL